MGQAIENMIFLFK